MQHLPSTRDNFQFLKGIESVIGKSGCKLKICKEYMNRGDRWMQVRSLNVLVEVNLLFGNGDWTIDMADSAVIILFFFPG